MRASLVLLVLALSAPAAGCNRVTSSAVATGRPAAPWHGGVRLVALAPPDDVAQKVGVVQAVGHDVDDLPELAREFTAKAASIGGDIAVVDRIRTKFEMITTTESYQYSCGDSKSYRTCTGMRTVTREHATTTMLGRAFRTRAASPPEDRSEAEDRDDE